ncbi:hypothetical protein CISIN_1g0392752mg, partial [Citrus sinensis]
MISGYSQAGRFNEALEPFGKLESLGVHTDEVTMVVVLTASSGPGAWILAKELQIELDLSSYSLSSKTSRYAHSGRIRLA